jgi:hypothetical protein
MGCPVVAKRRALRCKGHKPNGDPCPNYAMAGQEVCGRCGGKSPQAKRAAARRIAEAKAAKVVAKFSANGDAPPPADIFAAVDRLVHRTTVFEELLGERVDAALAGRVSRDELRADLDAHRLALGELRKLLLGLGRLGLEERALAIGSQRALLERLRAERIVEGIQAGLDYMGLTLEQRKRAQNGLAVTLLYLAGEREHGGT